MADREIAAHKQVRHLVEEVDIPEHVDRGDASHAEFERNRRFLIEEQRQGCWRCGSTTDLEVHHLLEWSFAAKIDWAVKAKRVLGVFRFYPWSEAEAAKVDCPDCLGNLLVLCAPCHRGVNELPGQPHTGYGLHTETWPAWLGQAAIKDPEDDITPDGHVVA